MKVIIVNHSKNNQINNKAHIASKDVQILVKKICDYFLTKKVRNKALLEQAKELTVVFLNSSEMKKINNQFRKKNKPTDILSFASGDSLSLGELLLCIDVLKKQAASQKHSLKHEITYMLIHGFLHLLGYDHELSLKEEKLMFRLQDECFEELFG